jgi:transcriptional regulator with XRE-family HTH domain
MKRRIRTRLRAARELRGYTQKELATRAGLSASYLATLERGDNEPTLPKARRLAAALDVTVDELWPNHDIKATALDGKAGNQSS